MNFKEIPFFQEIGKGLHRKTYKIGKSKFCIKIPHPFSFPPIISQTMDNEKSMYEISEKWGFDVVPYAKILYPQSEELKDIFHAFKNLMPDHHFSYPILLQIYIQEATKSHPFNLEQAQKVLFFNWITGREDRKKENSIIDSNGYIFEIDNEFAFLGIREKVMPHWLLTYIGDKPITEVVLNYILNMSDELDLFLSPMLKGLLESNLAFMKRLIRICQKRSISITPNFIQTHLIPPLS